jgi:hypothetical protein
VLCVVDPHHFDADLDAEFFLVRILLQIRIRLFSLSL